MARASREERMAELDVKMAQLEARKKQLAQQAKQEQRKQQERTWMRIGRSMAELGVDSEAKWEALQALVVDDLHWQRWIQQIQSVSKEEKGKESHGAQVTADPRSAFMIIDVEDRSTNGS